MEATLFLKNKIYRHIEWNGREFTFSRFVKNSYQELTDEVEKTFTFRGIFHDGGGYGGMLNFQIYEREGGRTLTRMKPMILCKYEDGKDLQIDDVVKIGDRMFRLLEKQDIDSLGIAFELSLEQDNGV